MGIPWQCQLCHTSHFPGAAGFTSPSLLPETHPGMGPCQAKLSELHHFSATQPELILFSLSPCLADSYGNIEPALEPVWALAVAGSSSIMWQRSTESLGYNLAQVKSVRQWVSGAGAAQSPALRDISQNLFAQVLLGEFAELGVQEWLSPQAWLGSSCSSCRALSQLGSRARSSSGSSAPL